MDAFRNYDRWLTTNPLEEQSEAEFEAYEDWCEEQGQEALEDPSEDEGWQLHCQEVNRKIDEDEARYYAELEAATCRLCDWAGAHDEGCPNDAGRERHPFELVAEMVVRPEKP